jgi:hypothetical protein
MGFGSSHRRGGGSRVEPPVDSPFLPRGVTAERRAAVAQIERTLKAWRKATWASDRTSPFSAKDGDEAVAFLARL